MSRYDYRAIFAILAIASTLLGSSACRRASDDAAELALELVDEARGEGISPEMLDGPRVERLRRILMLKRVDPAKVSAQALAELWEKAAEANLSEDERLSLRLKRASESVRRAVSGDCRAAIDEDLRKERVELLSKPIPGAPPEANGEIERISAELAEAKGIRVRCDHGEFGMLAMPGERQRVIDLFAIEEK